jgi:peptidyl-prolyl cis-trans isomerase D
MVGGGMEPKVAGAAYGIAINKVSAPVEGFTGFMLLLKNL